MQSVAARGRHGRRAAPPPTPWRRCSRVTRTSASVRSTRPSSACSPADVVALAEHHGGAEAAGHRRESAAGLACVPLAVDGGGARRVPERDPGHRVPGAGIELRVESHRQGRDPGGGRHARVLGPPHRRAGELPGRHALRAEARQACVRRGRTVRRPDQSGQAVRRRLRTPVALELDAVARRGRRDDSQGAGRGLHRRPHRLVGRLSPAAAQGVASRYRATPSTASATRFP